jgi:hypothetical protein
MAAGEKLRKISGLSRTGLRMAKQTAKAQLVRVAYAAGLARRSVRYSTKSFEYEPQAQIINDLVTDGFFVLRNAVPKAPLRQLMNEFEIALETENVGPITRNPGAEGDQQFLDKLEISLGSSAIASRADIAYAKDPLVSCPATLPLVFSDLVIDIGRAFYNCQPAVTDVSVMRTFVNDLPADGFGLFHCDYQSPRFIKFFFYLNDVGLDDGPFCYVRGSHRNKPLTWRGNNQRTLADVQKIYGPDAVRSLTAKVGDLIIADVGGFHRGLKPCARDRTVLMVNTGVHPVDVPDTNVLDRKFAEGLSPKLAAATDFMRRV